ncbi:hypothetical protein D3C83_267810 [compost metagenome]
MDETVGMNHCCVHLRAIAELVAHVVRELEIDPCEVGAPLPDVTGSLARYGVVYFADENP